MSNQTAELCQAALAEEPREAAASLPEQLIGLPGVRWALWRCVALRGAGFPASQVLRLSSPECGAAADILGEAAVDALVEEFRSARESVEAARREFQRAYTVATARASEEIRDVIDGKLFREAVTWQNRHAFNRVARTLTRKSTASRNSNQRRDEELIASYLQRYSVK